MRKNKNTVFWEQESKVFLEQLEASLKGMNEDELHSDQWKHFTLNDAQSCMKYYPLNVPEQNYPNILFYLVVFFGKPLVVDLEHDKISFDGERQDNEGPHEVLIENSYLPHDQWSIDWMIDDALNGLIFV